MCMQAVYFVTCSYCHISIGGLYQPVIASLTRGLFLCHHICNNCSYQGLLLPLGWSGQNSNTLLLFLPFLKKPLHLIMVSHIKVWYNIELHINRLVQKHFIEELIYQLSILLGSNTIWLGKWCPVFRDNVLLWSWASWPLNMRPLHFLEILGTSHPVTMHHIPEKWRPQLHYFKSLNLASHLWVCNVAEEAVLVDIAV
jgi:hypothetical protein